MRSRSGWSRRPANPEVKHVREAEGKAARLMHLAFLALARAGLPRTTAKRKADGFNEALHYYLAARVQCTEARRDQKRLEERVGRKTEAQAHDKAAISTLSPLLKELVEDLAELRTCVVAHHAHRLKDGHRLRPHDSEECRRWCAWSRDKSVPLESCRWCHKVEEWDHRHFSLDGYGYCCDRDEAVNFCCYTCFSDGRDLVDPAPRVARRPPVEEVELRADPPLQLLSGAVCSQDRRQVEQEADAAVDSAGQKLEDLTPSERHIFHRPAWRTASRQHQRGDQ